MTRPPLPDASTTGKESRKAASGPSPVGMSGASQDSTPSPRSAIAEAVASGGSVHQLSLSRLRDSDEDPAPDASAQGVAGLKARVDAAPRLEGSALPETAHERAGQTLDPDRLMRQGRKRSQRGHTRLLVEPSANEAYSRLCVSCKISGL
jgi:hypothetical protein